MPDIRDKRKYKRVQCIRCGQFDYLSDYIKEIYLCRLHKETLTGKKQGV